MGINWDNRNYGEDPPTQEEIESAERRRAMGTHRLHECEDENCYPCGGGLAVCTVCGGAEASLPYECPGARMTEEQDRAVQECRVDFIAGEWREKKS